MKDFDSFRTQIEESIFIEEELPERADMIFIPGNAYPHMARRAAELYLEKRAKWILPSGKYSIVKGKFEKLPGEGERYEGKFESEWEFLRQVLITHGVPSYAILKEDRATYTYENAVFSRQVTDQAQIEVKKAILCCKNYHARRAKMYYQRLFPETKFYIAPVSADGITRENWFQTAEGIRQITGEVERILTQFSLMMNEK